MNKSDLIAAVAAKTGTDKKVCASVIAAFEDTVEETLSGGDKVVMLGFGSFNTKTLPARTGVNPRTKEQIEIKESKTPYFKAGARLKKAVH